MRRARIAEIDESLMRIKDSKEAGFVQLRTDLEAERGKLRIEVAASRPVGTRLRDLAQRSLKLESRRKK